MDHIIEFISSNIIPLSIGTSLIVGKLIWDNKANDNNSNESEPASKKKNRSRKSSFTSLYVSPQSLSRFGLYRRVNHLNKNKPYRRF